MRLQTLLDKLKWPPIVYLIMAFNALSIFILVEKNSDQIPTLLISSIALGFSYYAYLFSKEKFRLDLLARRWEIYEQVLKFCSVVAIHGGLPKHGTDEAINQSVVSGLQAAHESFRGIGIHKTKSLFGPEIHEKFEKLNQMYAWFVARPRSGNWAEKEHKHLSEIFNTIEELPKLFKPYVYFGDYRSDSQ